MQDEDNIAADEHSDQHKPRKGDRIAFFSTKEDAWLHVTLTSVGMKRYGGHYHNYVLDDGTLGGVDLIPGTSWTHLSQDLGENVPDDNEYVATTAEISPPNDDNVDVATTAEIDPHNEAFEDPGVHNPLNIPFPKVQSLDMVLPLSSTPNVSTSAPPRPRLSEVVSSQWK